MTWNKLKFEGLDENETKAGGTLSLSFLFVCSFLYSKGRFTKEQAVKEGTPEISFF